MLAWPLAVRPIAAVELRLFMAFWASLALRPSRPFEPTPPVGRIRSARSVGTENCINAISAPNRRRLNSSVVYLAKFAPLKRIEFRNHQLCTIQKIYEVDLLNCLKCQAKMWVVVFIEECDVVKNKYRPPLIRRVMPESG